MYDEEDIKDIVDTAIKNHEGKNYAKIKRLEAENQREKESHRADNQKKDAEIQKINAEIQRGREIHRAEILDIIERTSDSALKKELMLKYNLPEEGKE